jgi:low temperature requirement protein LtrA
MIVGSPSVGEVGTAPCQARPLCPLRVAFSALTRAPMPSQTHGMTATEPIGPLRAPGPPSPTRHLRARAHGATQPTTTVELFFDLVYVFAVTQLSHLILDDLSLGGVASASFLLLVVWWAWIYTTWMVNWFDPTSPAVRTVLTGVMLASLLMAAALPEALDEDGVLFAASYVALQVGRNAAAASLLTRDHRLRSVFERLIVWSALTGVLWLGGAALDPDQRLLLWIPALALDLAAPVAGYWLPGRGRAATTDYDIEGGHFAERCQLFIIIALGESIVVTGATAAEAGLTSTVVLCLVVAFLETAALWWLYFGAAGEPSRAAMSADDDPGRLARDAYTYLHLPIVAGIIATAVGSNLLIADPGDPQHGVGLAMMVGGPALYLLGENLFQRTMTRKTNTKRLTVAGLLILLVPLAGNVAALLLGVIVTTLLAALAVWEWRTPRVPA